MRDPALREPKYALRVFLNWSGFSQTGLRAKLEDMATEEQKDIPEENTSEVPSDSELFAGEVHEELSEREAFAGDEDFYKRLADSTQDAEAGQPAGASQPPLVPIRHKYYFSNLQKVLVAGIVAIATILLYALLKSLPESAAGRTTPTVQQTATPKLPAEMLDTGYSILDENRESRIWNRAFWLQALQFHICQQRF